MKEFKLTDADWQAIEIAKKTAKRLLELPQPTREEAVEIEMHPFNRFVWLSKITPEQVTELTNALIALERLPLVTPGACYEFGLAHSEMEGTGRPCGMRYINFKITDSKFQIAKGGSSYRKSEGCVSYLEERLLVTAVGYRETEFIYGLQGLEDSIDEYLKLGAEIMVVDDSEIVEFKLTRDDEYAIEIAIDTANSSLNHPKITPEQAAGLKNALYALERLPLVTPRASCQFGLSYEGGSEEFHETRSIDFSICESEFSISDGGSVYNRDVGSDSISRPGWLININGYREPECDLCALQNDIATYLNLGAEITVDDQSEIEHEQDA